MGEAKRRRDAVQHGEPDPGPSGAKHARPHVNFIVSTCAGKVGCEIVDLIARSLPKLPHFTRFLAQPRKADGLGDCHEATCALMSDLGPLLSRRGDNGWWTVVLGTDGSGFGLHSWVEYRDVAIDLTVRDSIMIASTATLRAARQITAVQRFPVTKDGLVAYLVALPAV